MSKDIFVSVIGVGVFMVCAKAVSTVIGNVLEKDCYSAGYGAGYAETCSEIKDNAINSIRARKNQEKEGNNHD